jgi:uncharacterized surface protein with fasciclin (FAS1) repeats
MWSIREAVMVLLFLNELKLFSSVHFTGELACSTDFLSILCDTVALTELDETLSKGSWTFFAPTDNAFLDVLNSGLLARTDLLEPLQRLLLFHVTGGLVYKNDLKCSGLVPMVSYGRS